MVFGAIAGNASVSTFAALFFRLVVFDGSKQRNLLGEKDGSGSLLGKIGL